MSLLLGEFPKQQQNNVGRAKARVLFAFFGLALAAAAMLSAHAVFAAPVWFSGAETGNLSELGTASGTVSITTATVHTGGYAVEVNPTGGSAASLPLTQVQGDEFISFWFRYHTKPAVSDEDMLSVSSSTAVCGSFMLDSSGLTKFSNGTAGTTTLSADTWYLVEVDWVNGVSNIHWKINGHVEGTVSNPCSGNFGWTLGKNSDTNGNSVDFFYDDVALANSAYLGDGRIIAREGASGTPTYDNWTKTSCTGNVINGCWSDTPFNASSNANSAVDSAAQTMVVASFSAAGSANEGSQTIGAADTVNGAFVEFVGKTSNAGQSGGSMSSRFRFNSTDNDCTATVGTTDTFKPSYIDSPCMQTPTLSQLNTSEIGAVHGTNTKTQTVEDVWLMADYTPAAPAVPAGVQVSSRSDILSDPRMSATSNHAIAFTINNSLVTQSSSVTNTLTLNQQHPAKSETQTS